MGTFGTRPEDVVTDSRGNAVSGVPLTLYATQADAVAQTAPLGTATTVEGRWPLTVAAVDDAWVRTPAGVVYPVQSDSPRLTPASSTAASAIQPFLAQITRQATDPTLLVVGDSTGNDTTEWVYMLAQYLAASYPTHTVKYWLWSDPGKVYNPAVTVATGTGARTINVYNMSVAGWTASAPLTAAFATGIAAVQPDLTMVSLGHNEASVTIADGNPNLIISRYTALTESITAACPKTTMVAVAQNPSLVDSNQALRADAYQRIAALRGYGFIDVHQRFIDAGIPATWYLDNVHPSPAGETAWFEVVKAHFAAAPKAQPLTRPSSTLLEPTENLLVNGDFAAFTAATPDSWVNSGATCSKKTGSGNFESKNGYSVKIVPAAAGASGYINQAISIAATEALRGQWVTLAARVRIPAAVAGAGRISLTGAGAGLNSDTTTTQTIGGFHWVVLTKWVPFNASQLTVWLFGESGTSGTGEAWFDRVILSRGMFPRDLAKAF